MRTSSVGQQIKGQIQVNEHFQDRERRLGAQVDRRPTGPVPAGAEILRADAGQVGTGRL